MSTHIEDFIKQVSNLKYKVVNIPRHYIQWDNTESGRDKKQCYERESNNSYIRYVNTYNPNITVIPGEPFFDVLETLYNQAYFNNNL